VFYSVRGNGQVEKKTERLLKFTAEVMENVTRCLEAGESKRSIAEDLGVPESTLRKRLKTETVPTSLGRFKATFSSDEKKELADYCRDLDARFYGLTIRMLSVTAFIIDLTKKRRLLKRTG
jgi:transposase-like protein